MGTQPDGIIIRGSSLRQMLVFAYGLIRGIDELLPVSGGPSWTGTKKFNIQAKMDTETLAIFQALPPSEREKQRKLMLQALLAERFKVRAHTEERESPVYALMIDTTGIKLKQVPIDGEIKENSTPRGTMSATEGGIAGTAIGLAQVAFLLNNHGRLDRLVVDQTGDTKLYNLDIAWNAGTVENSNPNLPSLFKALEEQAGLRLVRTTAPVTYVVLDSAVEPSPN
jgi:uncharacterized protein (TIGR03435 family)